MQTCTVRTARTQFKRLIDSVADGKRVAITRRGRTVAHVQGATSQGVPFPDLAPLRASIRVTGEALSRTVRRGRDEQRY